MSETQGYRVDLNLAETTDESAVWGNLYRSGIDKDLRIITNNLRNKSVHKFNHLSPATGIGSVFNQFFEFGSDNEFIFSKDDVVGFSHTVTFPLSPSGTITIDPATDYYVTESDGRFRFKISTRPSFHPLGLDVVDINGNPTHMGSASRPWSDDGSLISFKVDGKYDGTRTGSPWNDLSYITDPTDLRHYTGSGTGAKFNISQVGTNLNVVITPDSGHVTGMKVGSGYRVGEILTFDSVGGGNDVRVIITDVQDLEVQRRDPVNQGDMLNFIKPEIMDDEHFRWVEGESLTSAFDNTQLRNENAAFFMTKKYRGNADTVTDRDIKFEGSMTIGDPANFNAQPSAHSDAKSPGVFIGDTRAFSTDNNPWSENIDATNGNSLRTDSEEITIGELNFADGISIAGIGTATISPATVSATVANGGWSHKIPVVINEETYYILLID